MIRKSAGCPHFGRYESDHLSRAASLSAGGPEPNSVGSTGHDIAMDTYDRQRLISLISRPVDATEQANKRELLERALCNHDPAKPSRDWHLCVSKQLPRADAVL